MSTTFQKPIFSVVMPIYNVEKYIRNAIESVLSQTYPHFELICVDDGGQDSSMDIVRSFDDPRIRIIRQKNRGLAAARNTGINHSRGLFVALLDSDDYWHRDKLLIHLAHFRQNPKLGVSYSPSLFVDDEGREMGIGQYPKLENVQPEDVFCRNPVGNGSAPVLKYRVFRDMAYMENIEGVDRVCYFDEKMRQSEDIDFWLRVVLTTDWHFGGVRQPLTYYRVNAGGLSANLEKQYQAWLYSVKKNFNLNPNFFKKWGSLSAAYQKRYLARRAIQSRNALSALSLIHRALFEDARILIREPVRTIVTYFCAILSILPNKIYSPIENIVMSMQGKISSH